MKTRVLVVEDSPTQAIALCAVLEESGFAPVRVASGEEALAALDMQAFDLVLSDIVMPGITGYELCRRIKQDPDRQALPVVLLTSLGDPLDIVRGLECGADNYVTKPFEPEYLCARLRNVLDRRRLRQSPKASLGVNVSLLGTTFSINSDKEQILDLFISSVEDVVRTNAALQESQRELAEAQQRLEEYARSLAQQARVSTEKYHLLMHEANDAIVVLDTDGHVIEANVAAVELLGRNEAELRGAPLAAFADPDSAPALAETLAALRSTPRVDAGELAFTGAGRRVYCDLAASRTSSDQGELVLAILHDVTELKEHAERLRRSEAMLADAERFAGMGSWERDLRTGRSQWSASLWSILGLDPTEHEPSDELLLSRVHPGDRDLLRTRHAEAVRSLRPLSVEFRVVRDDGTVRMVQARADFRRDERGEPVMIRGTIQDLTERKQLEEQLRQAQKMEAVGQLAGGIAHDFNNMLTVITSYAGLMLADLPADDVHRGDLREIEGAAQRAAALTRQLLAFSRRQVLQPQTVDLNDLTMGIEKMLRRLVREDIEIVTELAPGIGTVWADPGQLEQAIVNLAVNARDAMPDGGRLTIRTRQVDHAIAREEGNLAGATGLRACVLLEVEDTGTGMPPEVVARIFEPFFSTKEPGHGTGLGLSTVYGIISQSGGEITVDSTPGQGTTFRIYLPCGDGTAPEQRTTGTHAVPTRGGGETVLVVEDDVALRTVAARILEGNGYTVLQAGNGLEALSLLERHQGRIDVVVTDMVMPEMSGFELGETIARRHPGVRLLFMSGYTSDTVERQGLARDGVAYLDKPFSVTELAEKVRETLYSTGG